MTKNKDIFLFPKVKYKDKGTLPDTSGIYYVCNERKILYVGMTGDSNGFKNRFKNHHRSIEFSFVDRCSNGLDIYFWEISGDIESLEKQEIKRLCPVLNQTKRINAPTTKKDNTQSTAQLLNESFPKILNYCKDDFFSVGRKLSIARKDVGLGEEELINVVFKKSYTYYFLFGFLVTYTIKPIVKSYMLLAENLYLKKQQGEKE